jgi:gamma-glutamyltranspeptidase / glutathione hydrolase
MTRTSTLAFATALAAALALGQSAGHGQSAPPSAAPGSANDGPPVTAPTTPFDALRGDRAYGWIGQNRSEVVARHGMVATSQPLAAQVGLDVLKAGGNAFDAAVATAAALNVVEPYAAGIGGDMFMIAWSAKEKRLVALDGAGRAPAGATPDRWTRRGIRHIPYTGIDPVVVPGAVDGWHTVLARYGTLGFREVLEPAAKLAEEGFGVSERIADEWADTQKPLEGDAESRRVYLPNGRAPRPYELFRNPDLAAAFRLLQREGRDAFYKGAIGQAIVARSQALGGTMTMADLGRIQARWVTPLTTRYRGVDLYQMPPSTQGFALLEQLNIVEQCAPGLGIALKPGVNRTPAFWHLMIESKKLAYADLDRWNGDPDFSKVPTERLVSKDYARSLCARIDPNKATKPASAEQPIGGTVYISVADRFGNLVSFIYSVYGEFASGITVPGYGFLLNNRGYGFSLDPKSPNVIAPGKRPFYTLIPGFAMKDGKPLMAFGVMSGDQQAQGQAQVLVNMLDLGANLQAASDAARFNHNQRDDEVTLESELYAAVGPALQRMGHKVVRGNGVLMGGYQAIRVDPETGVMRGGSDHRKDGAAVGW